MEPSVAIAEALVQQEQRSALGDRARRERLGPKDTQLLGTMAQIGGFDRMPPTPAAELVPSRIQALGEALSAAKSPAARAALEAELQRLRGLAAQLNEIGQKYQPPYETPGPEAVYRDTYEPPQVFRGPSLDPRAQPFRGRM